jgi:manganese efflux pump family protein
MGYACWSRRLAHNTSLDACLTENNINRLDADHIMDPISLLGTAFALGMDAFAVAAAIAAGLAVVTNRHTFRLIWHFGLFQTMMTVIGWFGGSEIHRYIGKWAPWIAFIILLLLGLNMIRESSHRAEEAGGYDPTRGWSLMGLSTATSIDALAVGVSLGLLGVDIVIPALVIGLVALVMTFVGMRVGRKAGESLGEWAERLGGIVLIGIGFRTLLF